MGRRGKLTCLACRRRPQQGGHGKPPWPRDVHEQMGMGNQHAGGRHCRHPKRRRATEQHGSGAAAGRGSCRGTSGDSGGASFLIEGKDSQFRHPASCVSGSWTGDQVGRDGCRPKTAETAQAEQPPICTGTGEGTTRQTCRPRCKLIELLRNAREGVCYL
jgi:hypothetical protein